MMISGFVVFYSLLRLATPVNCSESQELQVQVKTVKPGDDVTMDCDINTITNKNNVFWYRQSFGKVPEFLAKPYRNTQGYTFNPGFDSLRFRIITNQSTFHLHINRVREEDGGEYYCGDLQGDLIRFTSGTHLDIQESKQLPKSRMLEISDSVLLNAQSSNYSRVEGSSCTEDIRMFLWLSVSRIGVLIILVLIVTVIHMIL